MEDLQCINDGMEEIHYCCLLRVNTNQNEQPAMEETVKDLQDPCALVNVCVHDLKIKNKRGNPGRKSKRKLSLLSLNFAIDHLDAPQQN